MLLKNDWYVAAWSEELGEQPLARTIANEAVVIFRDAEGRACILEDRCVHRGVALSLGRLTPQGVQCGYHGMVFDGSGSCVHIPGQDRIPSRACVRRYAVEERDSIVWMWAGRAEEADASMIVPYPWHNDPMWPTRKGLLHLNCSYEMLIDNIMDLTHLPFVHARTIGGGNAAEHMRALMKTEATPRGVKFVRWLLDSLPPPTYSKAVPFAGNIDRWQEEELFTPGLIIQFTGGVDVAQKAHEGGSREGGFAMRVMHGIVPETESSCHYFFSVSNGFGQDNPVYTDLLYNQVEATLKEDIVFCENQQALLDARPDAPFVDLRSDEARVIYHRHLARRQADEAEFENARREAGAMA